MFRHNWLKKCPTLGAFLNSSNHSQLAGTIALRVLLPSWLLFLSHEGSLALLDPTAISGRGSRRACSKDIYLDTGTAIRLNNYIYLIYPLVQPLSACEPQILQFGYRKINIKYFFFLFNSGSDL